MNRNGCGNRCPEIKDCGPEPFIVNIDRLSKINRNYRTALWTGEHLQVTLMSIPVGGDIGLEMHENLDQFIRIEDGCALVQMGKCRDTLNYQQQINNNYAVIIPACTWHNITNTGCTPLKLYSIYAPPQHPFGTVHKTKEEAEKEENHK
jgi:mannose-6-phosphate isomerase-like protein (cupin superfamily)